MRIEEKILDLSNKNKEVLGLLEQKSNEFTSVVTLLKQVISNGNRHEVTSDAEITCKDVPGPSLAVNKEIENICIRNQWHFVDNGNIDITGISIDGLHLNRSGLDILTTSFRML